MNLSSMSVLRPGYGDLSRNLAEGSLLKSEVQVINTTVEQRFA
jgi:hypothetical protein